MKFGIILLSMVAFTVSQDYQVSDISCDFGDDVPGYQRMSARLSKPQGFKGHPIFADDRSANPLSDGKCQIRHDTLDDSGLVYNLLVTDMTRCGVVKKDGYVTLRVWFAQLEGVVLATDQEVIIMCKPASPTIIENRAAGFAGSLPSTGRVSGVVEESPGRLEYEVALYRETTARSAQSHSPVDQAVPIGSRLQIRARINTHSTWKYIKLMEVTVSSDPASPYAPGHVTLVKNGCRLPEFVSIVPKQPQRSEEEFGEVRLDFEAFMLDSKMSGSSSQLWIHATIKACIDSRDCLPEFCLDLFQPSGHGKRRRRRNTNYAEGLLRVSKEQEEPLSTFQSSTVLPGTAQPLTDALKADGNASKKVLLQKEAQTTKIGNNVGITVIMPEEFFTSTEALYQSCATFMVLSGFLGFSVLLATGFLCFLTSRLHKTASLAHKSTLNSVVKEHHNKYGLRDFLKPPFQ